MSRTSYLACVFICSTVCAHETVLEHAVQFDSIDRVKDLLAGGEHLTDQACIYVMGRHDMAKFFMDIFKEHTPFFLDRSEINRCLNTMLIHAKTEWQRVKLIRLGANVHDTDEHDLSALDYAVRADDKKFAKLLRSQGALADDIVDQKLFAQIAKDELSCDFLHTYFSGINRRAINRSLPEYDNLDALSWAVKHGAYGAARQLLRYGAHNVQGAFLHALRFSDQDMFQLLMDHGALFKRAPRAIQTIIETNPHAPELMGWISKFLCTKDRNEALLHACLHAKKDVAQVLIDHGARVNYVSPRGNSALFNALLSRDNTIINWVKSQKKYAVLTLEQEKFMRVYLPVK